MPNAYTNLDNSDETTECETDHKDYMSEKELDNSDTDNKQKVDVILGYT